MHRDMKCPMTIHTRVYSAILNRDEAILMFVCFLTLYISIHVIIDDVNTHIVWVSLYFWEKNENQTFFLIWSHCRCLVIKPFYCYIVFFRCVCRCLYLFVWLTKFHWSVTFSLKPNSILTTMFPLVSSSTLLQLFLLLTFDMAASPSGSRPAHLFIICYYMLLYVYYHMFITTVPYEGINGWIQGNNT